MRHQDQFLRRRIRQDGRDGRVGVADIEGVVAKGALSDALEDVKGDTVGGVVNAEDGAAEGQGQPVQVALQPVGADGDAVDEEPAFTRVRWVRRTPFVGGGGGVGGVCAAGGEGVAGGAVEEVAE